MPCSLGSDPNSIKLGSKGIIPVAILTNYDFEAATADPDAIAFDPADAAAVLHAIEDVDNDDNCGIII